MTTETLKKEMTEFLIDKGTTRPFVIDSIERISLNDTYLVYCTVKVVDYNIPIDNLEGTANLIATVNAPSFRRWKEDKIKWTQPVDLK